MGQVGQRQPQVPSLSPGFPFLVLDSPQAHPFVPCQPCSLGKPETWAWILPCA